MAASRFWKFSFRENQSQYDLRRLRLRRSFRDGCSVCCVIIRLGIALTRTDYSSLFIGLFLLQFFFFLLLFCQFFLAFLESVIWCGHSFLSS